MDLNKKIAGILSEQLLEEITAIRRKLHQNPELSFREFRTSETIRKYLDQWGVPYTFPHVETGIVATIRGDRPGKRIALRTDMDGLPVYERTGLPFSSTNDGVMHACGHDIHMACMLGAIRVLNQLKNEIAGEVLILFQPGEELNPGGAKLMLEEGVFEGRKPDMIIAQHVLPEMDAGQVGFKSGIYMASTDEIYITVRGKGGHGALRDQIRDPVLMASRILITLQEEINRQAPDRVPTVLSFGKVLADGAVNVIPDQVILEGTFRTMNEEWRKEAHRLISKISSEITSDMGGFADLVIKHGYPVLYNHEQLTRESAKIAIQLLGNSHVESMNIRMTAEDFAWFARDIPGMMYRLGVRDPQEQITYPLHSPRFRAHESSLRTGISLMAALAIELLKIEHVEKINR